MSGVSPLAPAGFPDIGAIAGVKLATFSSGIRYTNRDDVMLARLASGTSVAGVFTRSATRSAAVLDCQEKIGGPTDAGAAILVNAGNANAFTGKHGMASVEAITKAVARETDVPQDRVFTSSTGVIGEPLPHAKITDALGTMSAKLGQADFCAAAQAIKTTDTFAKGAYLQVETAQGIVNIAGIAKGSGMIAPDMATMLVYIFTDAKIDQPALQALISDLNAKTFNCITVDSDTSTSDTLLCAATGQSGVDVTISAEFSGALHNLMLDLAHQVVRDGEGATKFVTVNITGATNDQDARTHALAIANSPLVKTAIAGEDPNWGRIVMAIGKSGAAADRDLLSIRFGDILVAQHGWVADSYSEDQGATYMRSPELDITVDLGLGDGRSTVWTCDLTHGYIEINADYRS